MQPDERKAKTEYNRIKFTKLLKSWEVFKVRRRSVVKLLKRTNAIRCACACTPQKAKLKPIIKNQPHNDWRERRSSKLH